MSYENLPGQFGHLIDGNLNVSPVSSAPVVLVMGTASRGTNRFYSVDSVSTAVNEFGRTDGTLVRGLFEVLSGGATNIRLLRIGAVAATLADVGGGITIETVSKDAGAGSDYKIFWEDSTGRLRVWRTSDDFLVYDNNPVYPSAAIDENEVSVSGTAVGNPGDIGSLAVPITLALSDGVSGASYTAGDDGVLLSRMELYEALYKGYLEIENEDIDLVLPRNVYADDSNVRDMTTAEVSALNTSAPWASSSTYPTPGTFYDALGEVFAQEYQGEWYFWWDLDRDGIAEIYPSVGSASATTDANGVALESSDFNEANFAYQLADFCYRQSENHDMMHGAVGVKPPVSWSGKDVNAWIGKEPVSSEDSAGNEVISTNGTGLLGLKWVAGRKANAGTGLPGHAINSVDGLKFGGFIATDSGYPGGNQLKDRNDHLIDIGKYLSLVAGQVVMSNSASALPYVSAGVAPYVGLVSSLAENSAPTNKVQPGIRLPFRIATSKVDTLAGYGYVMFHSKPNKGIVVADAPTAARPDSDYKRLSTVRIVKAVIDGIRAAGEPFLGEAITGPRLAALETNVDQSLLKAQKGEYLQRYDFVVISTPTMQVQGKANIELVCVPAFELRQISVYVALAAS